jgi:glucose/arabinose dehydrogenase
MTFAVKISSLICIIYLLTSCDNNLPDESQKHNKDDVLTLGPWCMDEKDRLPGQPKPYCGSLPSLASVNIREAKIEVISEDLDRPWAMEFINENELLITEFKGELKLLNVGTGNLTDISGLPPVAFGQGQRGLLDIAIHPSFAENKQIYFSYVAQSLTDTAYALHLASATVGPSSLENVTDIFIATPYIDKSSNFGGAILFDSQGKIIFSIGDRSLSKKSQDPSHLVGKIIRINDDGSIPSDNPFIKDSRFHPAIYAYGVRNPQGLILDPKTNLIYETEHGPMGGDEVNILKAGKNYGWPKISYGMNYTYKKMGIGTSRDGLEQPFFYYLPSRAISPIAIYNGAMFPEWNGDLLVGTLRAMSISKLDVVDGRVISESTILKNIGRTRDIKTATDGSIYILTENGELLRLSRHIVEPKNLTVGERSGKEVYQLTCQSCHSNNAVDAPQFGSSNDWKERIEKGNITLKVNAIQGINNMPAKGHCTDCTNWELGIAVDYIIEHIPE